MGYWYADPTTGDLMVLLGDGTHLNVSRAKVSPLLALIFDRAEATLRRADSEAGKPKRKRKRR